MSARGMGPQAVTDPGATLNIYSSDAQCVTGKLSGLKDPTFPEARDYNGAFFGLRCSQ